MTAWGKLRSNVQKENEVKLRNFIVDALFEEETFTPTVSHSISSLGLPRSSSGPERRWRRHKTSQLFWKFLRIWNPKSSSHNILYLVPSALHQLRPKYFSLSWSAYRGPRIPRFIRPKRYCLISALKREQSRNVFGAVLNPWVSLCIIAYRKISTTVF